MKEARQTALGRMYRLCDRPFTVYRRQDDGTVVRRRVKCYYESKTIYSVDNAGTPHATSTFLLICPTDDPDLIIPQDRVLPGEGPEIMADEWPTFLPAKYPGLVIVKTSTPYYFAGEIRHIEAGGLL